MSKDVCSCCYNHCPKDNLSCGRGRDYFNNLNSDNFDTNSKIEDKPKTLNEEVISDLRKCGHMLHHNRDINGDDLLSSLSSEDVEKLHELLSKICD